MFVRNNNCLFRWRMKYIVRELLQRYKEQGEEVDYLELQNKLRCINFNNGLTQEENEILFNTVYVDEAIQLILKGLQSI